jgi:uncharacterized protein YjiS (DUF1127 family)
MEAIMNILANVLRARRRRLAASQLRALPPHLLSDIGVEPDRIDETVSQILAAQAAAEAPAIRPASEPLAFKPAALSHTGDWPYSSRRAA